MKVEVNVNKNCEETKIVIHTKSIEDKIIKLIENLQIKETEQINGFKDDEMYLLSQDNIESFYTENWKVFARINENKYLIKKRLYELEEILNPDKFVRISNSEIINMRKVKKITGTIILYLLLIIKHMYQEDIWKK